MPGRGSMVRAVLAIALCLLGSAYDRATGFPLHAGDPPAKCEEPLSLTPPQIQALFSGAEAGDAQDECLLGIVYHHGFSVRQDDAEAAKWLSKAAAAGVAL